jgi:transcriptional regulator with PAS, ATPase and Fis domain
LSGDFVPINIAGLDDSIFSDTLFGHKKGAFTGATEERKGLIEKANNGTLFLDEIGDLDSGAQVKLLRLLQEEKYYPIGSDQEKVSGARIICATNKDLKSKMKRGKFREDLYYRLMVHHIHLPPLRERSDDINLLTDYFIEKSAKSLSRKKPTIPKELYTLLSIYPFPGNIRELQSLVYDSISRHENKMLSLNVFKDYIYKYSSNNGDDRIDIDHLNNSIIKKDTFPKLKEVETFLIEEALKRAEGNQSVAALMLGVSQSTLSRRMKE